VNTSAGEHCICGGRAASEPQPFPNLNQFHSEQNPGAALSLNQES
jgi:hypothetical protein